MVHKGFKYTQKDIDEAVASIKCGMSIRSAAKKFGVPKSTLSDVISGKKNTKHPAVLGSILTVDDSACEFNL